MNGAAESFRAFWAPFLLLAMLAVQPAFAATINCPAGTTATGSGYATGGTGTLRESVFWLDWSCGATTVFAAGDIVNKSWTLPSGIVITGQVSGISHQLTPYNTGGWAGDLLDNLYSGVNPIGLMGLVDGVDPTFTITLSASYNGAALSLPFIVADAEDTGENGERITVTTNGGNWTVLETSGVMTVTNTGSSITFSDPANAGGGTALAQTSASSLSLGVSMVQQGLQAVAIAYRTQRDYSDGPAGYGGANHIIIPGLSLGASATAETADYSSATSAGDTDNGLTMPLLARSVATPIPVAVSGTGFLRAWFDWNVDGDFADAGEQVATDVQDGGSGDADGTVNGTIRLTVTPPATAGLTASTARFRWSGASGEASSGAGAPGEVEDYAYTVSAIPDRGDAPASYGEAWHNFTGTPRMGANNIDADSASLASASANGDDASGASDENGVTFANFVKGVPTSVQVSVTTVAATRLSAWVDWNGDGDFTDSGEQIATDIQNNVAPDTNASTSAITFALTPPVNAVPATFGRFRISDSSGLGPTGGAATGEVEDYPIVVFDSGDRGDAPWSYGDAVHAIAGSLRLGSNAPDVNNTLVNSTNADGDDTTGTDDEDGVTLPAMVQGGTASISVSVSGAGGLLQGWADFNGNGVFDSGAERIATNVSDNGAGDSNAASGVITLSVAVPSNAVTTQSMMRFRWSSTANLAATGLASDGEVEDYAFTLSSRMPPTGTASCTGTNIASNGGFELPDYTAAPNYYLEATSNVPGWTTTDTVIEIWDSGFLGVASHTGDQFAELNAYISGTLQQNVPIIQRRGELVVYWAHRGRWGTDTANLLITDNGGGSLNYGNFSTSSAAWAVRSATFVASPTATAMTMAFTAVSTASGDTAIGNFLDTVEVCQTYITLAKSFVSKTDTDGSGSDTQGDTIAYRFTVANPAGNARSISSVQITDDKIGTFTATATSGDANSNGVLDVGESWIVDRNYTLTQTDIDAETIVNVAYAQGSTSANTIRSDNATVTVPLAGNAAMTVTKTASAPGFTTGNVTGAPAGTVITYTYVVQNTGNQTLSAIALSDLHNGTGTVPVPGSETLTLDATPLSNSTDATAANGIWSSLAPGDAVTFTATYTVTQSDVDLLQE